MLAYQTLCRRPAAAAGAAAPRACGSAAAAPRARLGLGLATRGLDARTRTALQATLATTRHQRAPQRVCATSTAAVAAAAADAPDEKQGASAVRVTFYVFLWYAFNIMFNLINKSTLNTFSAPWFLATFQLVASGACMAVLWATGLQPRPLVDGRLLRALLPVALFHTIGHVSACVSFSQMAVSFAHVVKSAEPVLSVALSGLLLGETYPVYVWLSLVPIIGGCSLAAMKEVSFAWGGFNNAMISNFGMVLRNIYSKKALGDFKIDGINLFGLLSILSIPICLPAALFMEGFKGGVWQWGVMWDAAVAAAGLLPLLQLLALGGVFYHLYNQASYMVLDQGISPVTFSVGNTMKRVAVVVSSVLFFRNPVSALNWIGSMMALLGTGLYSLAKQRATDEAKAAKAAAAS